MGETVSFSVDPSRHDDLVTGSLVGEVDGAPLTINVTIPVGPATAQDLLPMFHDMSSMFAERGESQVERAGKRVSCRAGCGACCRQMVPLPGAELRHIADLVANMPEPRQSVIRARFDAAIAAMEAAGLLDAISDPARFTAEAGVAYFHQRVPCPFLEDESCSIHPVRPLACREFLVTSPPENCTDPEDKGIEPVPIAWKLMRALLRADPGESWAPLILALRKAEHAPPAPVSTGPEIVKAVVSAVHA